MTCPFCDDILTDLPISFYVNIRYVSVCYNILYNDNEVIDRTGGGIETIHQSHKRHPSIVQLEDDALSSLSSNTLSSSLSDTLSLLLSDNSSRFSTSVRSSTNSDNDDLFQSSSQSRKNSNRSSKNKISENQYPIMFYPFAIGLWVKCQKVATRIHIKNCVKKKYLVQKCQKCYIAHTKGVR